MGDIWETLFRVYERNFAAIIIGAKTNEQGVGDCQKGVSSLATGFTATPWSR